MYRGHPNVWGHMDTPSLRKHAFFVLHMYRGHPNIIQTYRGIQMYGGVQAYRGLPNIGVIQTYGVVQTYWEAYGASKDTGSHPNMRGIQTYGASNIQGSKHMGASKCMGAYGHPLSLTRHAFFMLCMYRGHPNVFWYNHKLYLPS